MNYFRNRSRTPVKQHVKNEESLNKSASTNQLNYNKILKLPNNFAEDLLQYEMELEKKVITIEIINRILELYSTAIEYYESHNDDRYLIFKNKMSALWLKANVLEALNQQDGQFYSNRGSKLDAPQQSKNVNPLKQNQMKNDDQLNFKMAQKQKALDIQFQYELLRNKGSNPKLFIQKHDKLHTERAQVIQNENTSQRVQLLQRIKTRQQSISPMGKGKSPVKEEGCSTPKFKKKDKTNLFMQKQLDVIQQQKTNEKQQMINKINEKGENQIKLLKVQIKEGRNNELIYKLIEKIKKEIEEEREMIEKETTEKYESLIEHLK